MAKMFDNTIKKDRVLLAAVDTGSYDVELSLDELEELTETAGGEVIARVTQKRPSFDSSTCIGSGIKKHTLRRVTKTLYGRVGAACANAPA